MVRTNEEIKKDVVDQLFWDDRVDAAEVTVEVDDGTVTLNGSVPTLIARHFASADAMQVAGVAALDNCLDVRYPAIATAPSDTQIRSNVENVLEWNPSIDAEQIRVKVENGIVTLEGSVDALWKKFHIEEVVSQLSGVTAIDNQLVGVPTKDTSDEMIAEWVVNALNRNPSLNSQPIEVRVVNGVVRLAGVVPNWPARQTAIDVALHTFGALGVDDQLKIAD